MAANYPDVVADFQSAAAGAGLDWNTSYCQINQESGFNPDAESSAGAEGAAQFIPATWSVYGGSGDPYDPVAAAPAWAAYMTQLLGQFGSYPMALAGYNCGAGCVQKAIAKCGAANFLACTPGQTQTYVRAIESCAGSGAAPSSGVLGSVGGTLAGLGISLPDFSAWSTTDWILLAAAAAAVLYFVVM